MIKKISSLPWGRGWESNPGLHVANGTFGFDLLRERPNRAIRFDFRSRRRFHQFQIQKICSNQDLNFFMVSNLKTFCIGIKQEKEAMLCRGERLKPMHSWTTLFYLNDIWYTKKIKKKNSYDDLVIGCMSDDYLFRTILFNDPSGLVVRHD